MKLTIDAKLFKGMVAKAIKGSVFANREITRMMAISLKDNELVLTTTDGNNFLYVKEQKVVGDDFYVVVPVDNFSKLIAKQTCDKIVLEMLSRDGELDKLIVKGNGRYQIELPYDVDGSLIKFPDPLADDIEGAVDEKVQLSTVRLMLSTAKASLMSSKAQKGEMNCYKGYYVGDRIVTTDSYKICSIDIKLFDRPMLLSAEMVDLLDIFNDEIINVRHNDEVLVFTTSNAVLYGPVMDGIEEFSIGPISNLIDSPFPSSCRIDKMLLLQVLDRLALFVGTIDDHIIRLTFVRDGLRINSLFDNGSEMIPYVESINFIDFTCLINIELLKSQVKANTSGLIDILYGEETSVKIIGTSNPNVKQIIGLAEGDPRESSN